MEQALRREAKRTGRSQQEVTRKAIGRQLELMAGGSSHGELSVLVSSGAVRAPRTPYRRAARRLVLPVGVSSTDLLDRGDRL
jgi:uncharacterized protein YoaH (UPF0181 family)